MHLDFVLSLYYYCSGVSFSCLLLLLLPLRSSRCSLFSSCRRYRLFSLLLLNRSALCSSVCCCLWRLSVSRLLSNLCCRCSSLSRCLNIISLYRLLSDRHCKNVVPASSIDIELRRIKQAITCVAPHSAYLYRQ